MLLLGQTFFVDYVVVVSFKYISTPIRTHGYRSGRICLSVLVCIAVAVFQAPNEDNILKNNYVLVAIAYNKYPSVVSQSMAKITQKTTKNRTIYIMGQCLLVFALSPAPVIPAMLHPGSTIS